MKKPKTKFERMTKAQQRVAIAKDAIQQIRARKLLVVNGEYVILPTNVSVLKQKNSRGAVCQACQIGQAIVCGIRLFNKQRTKTIPGFDCRSAFRKAISWFSPETVALMEGAFEGAGCWQTRDLALLSWGRAEAAQSFHGRYKTYRARSIAIWKNIIKNHGEFIP